MNKIVYILLLLILTAGLPAFAQELSVGVVSSGGHPDLTDGTTHLHDLKGQGVIGESTAADGTVVQIGGIYLFPMPVELPGVFPGTVPLSIRRSGNRVGDNIIVSWDNTLFPNPRIFVLAGDGTGQYSNVPASWRRVTGSGALVAGLPAGLGTFSLTAGELTHRNEVGGGRPEAYYKALVDAAGEGGPLAQAAAVGKFNINIDPGFNLVSVPFNPLPINTLTAVFGSQLTGGSVSTADRIYFKDRANSWGMQNAYLGADGRWYWSNQPNVETTIVVNPVSGYLVRNNANSRAIVTVAGRVIDQATITLNQGFNAVGTAFPLNLALNTLLPPGARRGRVDAADRIYFKDRASSWGMQNAYLDDAAGAWRWSNRPDTNADFTFRPPFGYFYLKRETGEISWGRTIP